jgi:hypothetical protein
MSRGVGAIVVLAGVLLAKAACADERAPISNADLNGQTLN